MDIKIEDQKLDKLVKAVSKVTGGLLEPTHIRRRARALADAQAIGAKARQETALIDVDTEAMVALKKIQLLQSYPELALASDEYKQLAERAAHRIFDQEIRRQNNIENITAQAALHLPPPGSGSDKEVSEDWVNNFFNECQDIGDSELQILWGKILAGEVSSPGTFSRKAIMIVKQIEKRDIELLQSVANYFWSVDDSIFIAIQGSPSDDLFSKYGITTGALVLLDRLGLIERDLLVSIKVGGKKVLRYGNNRHVIFNNTKKNISIHGALLTLAGMELFRLIEFNPNFDYEKDVLTFSARKGATIVSEDD